MPWFNKFPDLKNDPRYLEPRMNQLDAQLAENEKQIIRRSSYKSSSHTFEKTTPMITFVDDDGRIETYNKIFPLFQQKGEKFVAAITSGLVGKTSPYQYMTKEQVDEIYNAGHEISSHGVTHEQFPIVPYELGDSYFQLNENGWEVETVTYVGGASDDDSIAEAKKFYSCGVGVGGGVNTIPIKNMKVDRNAFGSFLGNTFNGITEDGTLANYKAVIDYAIANNGWVVFMLHSWHTDHDATQQQYLSDLIDYIQSTSAEIVTLKEGFKRFGNPLEISNLAKNRYFNVLPNGDIDSLYLKNKIIDEVTFNSNTITINSPPSAFPKGKISYHNFQGGIATGFPISTAGDLITHQLKDEYFCFQYWYPQNNYTKYAYRKWNPDLAKWENFNTIDLAPGTTTKVNEKISQLVIPQIAANSFQSVTINTTQASLIDPLNDILVMSPVGGIEDGLHWNIHLWTNKTVVLKVFNTKTTAVTPATRDWILKEV